MAGEPTPVSPAGEARIEAAMAQAVAAETTAAEAVELVDNAAVARAQEAVERAEDAAEDVALAAMQTTVGQAIAALDARLTTWQNEHNATHEGLSGELASLKVQMAEILAKLSAQTPIVEVSSTPPMSPAPETVAAVTVNPESASPAPMPDAPAAPAKRKIRLI